MNTAAILVTLSICIASSIALGQPADRADEAAIRRLTATLESGWNNHDMNEYMSVLSPDANFVNVNGWWWQGYDEIKQAHVTAHQTTFQFSTAKVASQKIRFVKSDLAVVQAAWTVVGDVRKPDPREYMMTMVFARRAGRWSLTDAQNGSKEDRSGSPMTANLTSARTFQNSPSTIYSRSGAPGETALRQALENISRRWTEGDIKALLRFYTEDADVVDTQGQWHKGRTDIEKYASEFRRSTFDRGEYHLELAKLALIHPDVAVATTRWIASSASSGPSVRGMGIIVLLRNKPGWQIVAEQKTISRGEPPKK